MGWRHAASQKARNLVRSAGQSIASAILKQREASPKVTRLNERIRKILAWRALLIRAGVGDAHIRHP
jgi:hypothetical protein